MIRVAGVRPDGAYWLLLDGGMACILLGDRSSPAVDPSEVEALGPWDAPTGTTSVHRQALAAKLASARTAPLLSLASPEAMRRRKFKFEYETFDEAPKEKEPTPTTAPAHPPSDDPDAEADADAEKADALPPPPKAKKGEQIIGDKPDENPADEIVEKASKKLKASDPPVPAKKDEPAPPPPGPAGVPSGTVPEDEDDAENGEPPANPAKTLASKKALYGIDDPDASKPAGLTLAEIFAGGGEAAREVFTLHVDAMVGGPAPGTRRGTVDQARQDAYVQQHTFNSGDRIAALRRLRGFHREQAKLSRDTVTGSKHLSALRVVNATLVSLGDFDEATAARDDAGRFAGK